MNKKELRQHFTDVLTYFQAFGEKSQLEKIYYSLVTSEQWEVSKTIGITLSFDFELDTIPLIECAWEQGKTIVVPRCSPKDKTISFYKITTFDHVENGHMDIPEPNLLKCEMVDSGKIDMIVAPGLAFNFDGYRLGRGAGYYDKFLATFNGSKVALAISEILTNELVVEKHDIPVDVIFTEHGVISCKK